MRGGCYSSKEMEGERKGTRSRTIYESIKREKNGEKPTKEILSVYYKRACI